MIHLYKYCLSLLFVTGTFLGMSQEYSQEEMIDSGVQIAFDTMVQSFDTMDQGDSFRAVFTLKNTGTKHVVVRQVWPSCGCSVVDFQKTAIKPKETMEIVISFDSHDKEGFVENNFQVFSNAGYHVLFLRGFVRKPL